ncbi:MAG: ABC transporter ATP-binding protein [Betaproteobacteria bacterium]|nr:ABC transporter ATP-binding protein [Betaproteobacteria bacterium]
MTGHLVVLVGLITAVGSAIGAQYAVKDLVDVLGGHPSDRALWRAVALLLVLVGSDNLAWRLAGWGATQAFVAVGGDIQRELFRHLSGHSSQYFTEQLPGALAGRITTAASAAWIIENLVAFNALPPALAVVSSIAVLSLISWRLTTILVAIVVALGALIGWFAARGHHLHERFAGQAAAVAGDLADIVSNIAVVRAFGAERREQARLSHKIEFEMTAQRASLRFLERIRLLHAVSVFAVTAGVLVWSVRLWQEHRITTGDVVLATTLGFTVLHASRDLAMALVELVQHMAKLGEAIQVLGLPHEMEDAPDAIALAVRRGGISIDDVHFSYPNGQQVLLGITLQIEPGSKVGLVGPSGAGKSTLFALLQRHYDPDHGQIRIDGQDIARVTQASLRRSIAVVEQNISLFNRTVLENLRYGRLDATDEEVYQAVEAARCTEFILRLPSGFRTVVGDRGTKLSGGQRQRLAIVRAFLKDAPIILLDEATSELDSESEEAIQEALARLFKGRTVVAIAHRLSTLNAFERIVVLDRGRVVEDGSLSALLGRRSIYSRMYERQFGGVKAR